MSARGLNKVMLFAILFLSFSSCDIPCTRYIVPYSMRDTYARRLRDLVASANPHSDEEPEDNIKQAAYVLEKTYSIAVNGEWNGFKQKCECDSAEVIRALNDTTLIKYTKE